MIFNRIVFSLISISVLCVSEDADGEDAKSEDSVSVEEIFGAYHSTFLREGDECIDKATGLVGLCTPMHFCQSVQGREKYYEQNGTTCWYGEGDVILCCLERNPVWDPPNERTISQKMCLEYNDDTSQWVVDTPPTRPTSIPSPSTSNHPTSLTYKTNRTRRSIFHGKPTLPNEFPHMAALGWLTKSRQLDFKCGGMLISSLFILTAGHCTTASSRDTDLISKEPTIVRLGVHELHVRYSSRKEAFAKSIGREDAPVRRIVRHPAYKPPAVYNDIALIEMRLPVELNKFVRPACLWHKGDFGDRKRAIVTGWGATSHNGERSNILLKADLSLFSNEFCQPLLVHLRNRKWKHGLSPEQMCAGDLERNYDSCRGDSGGPLQINFPFDPNIYYVVGITSFGDNCPAGSGVAVYTRVSSFIPWIESVVWPDQKAKILNLTSEDNKSS